MVKNDAVGKVGAPMLVKRCLSSGSFLLTPDVLKELEHNLSFRREYLRGIYPLLPQCVSDEDLLSLASRLTYWYTDTDPSTLPGVAPLFHAGCDEPPRFETGAFKNSEVSFSRHFPEGGADFAGADHTFVEV